MLNRNKLLPRTRSISISISISIGIGIGGDREQNMGRGLFDVLDNIVHF
jgi:hypothetical protein